MAKTKEEVMAEMEMAGESARAKLGEVIDTMTEQELEGASKLVKWLAENYQAAGYKRLCRIMMVELAN